MKKKNLKERIENLKANVSSVEISEHTKTLIECRAILEQIVGIAESIKTDVLKQKVMPPDIFDSKFIALDEEFSNLISLSVEFTSTNNDFKMI